MQNVHKVYIQNVWKSTTPYASLLPITTGSSVPIDVSEVVGVRLRGFSKNG